METPKVNGLSFNTTNHKDPSISNKLGDILPSTKGYFIRPYVRLRGQTNGYQWSPFRRGNWSQFMDINKKTIELSSTGNNKTIVSFFFPIVINSSS